jgi:hypothetical protein
LIARESTRRRAGKNVSKKARGGVKRNQNR